MFSHVCLVHISSISSEIAQDILAIIDEFMHYASDYVKVIISDGETCNTLLRKVVHGVGRILPEHKKRLSKLKFFSLVRHHQIAGVEALPRFPMQMCCIRDRTLFVMGATAHCLKNSSAQAMASHRVLMFGKFFCDASPCLRHALPVPAFARKDPMSDRLNALLCSPLFMISQKVLFGNLWEDVWHYLEMFFYRMVSFQYVLVK